MRLGAFILATVLLATMIGLSYFAVNKAINKSSQEMNTNFDDLTAHINSRVYKIELDGNKFKRVKNLNITLQPNVEEGRDTLSDIMISDTTNTDTVYVFIK